VSQRASEHQNETAAVRPLGPAPTTTGSAESPILSLQRQAGNAATTDYLAMGAELWNKGKQLTEEANKVEWAGSYAESIYNLLWGWNTEADNASALGYLTGLSMVQRLAVQNAFYQKYETTLEDYLISELAEDAMVEGLALLNAENTLGFHVALGRALLGTGVREAEPLRILSKLPLSARKTVETAYNAAFTKAGEGNLKADIAAKLEDENKQEALVLLDHDVTPGERLYLDSVAVSWGTKTDAVVAQIRDAFKAGPGKLGELEDDWDARVVGHSGDNETWTSMTMTEALGSELSGESWNLVKACMDGLRMYQVAKGAFALDQALGLGAYNPTMFTPLELAELETAEKTFLAATTQGIGIGTNVSAMNDALPVFRRVHMARLKRAEEFLAPEEVLQQLQWEWDQKRAQLAGVAEGETSGAAEKTANLLLVADPTPADRLYLAEIAVDAAAAVKVVTDAWIADQIGKIHSDAREPRIVDGVEVRPRFNPMISGFIRSNQTFQRLTTMLEPAADQATRGAKRLYFELDLVDGPEELKVVTDFLTAVPDGLRASVIAVFMRWQGQVVEKDAHSDDHPGRQMVKWLALTKGMEASTEFWNFADLVDPDTSYKDPRERAALVYERAQGRHDALHSGMELVNAAWFEEQRSEDQASGEDRVEAEEESLERLKYLSDNAYDPNQRGFQELMAQSGMADLGAFASMEGSMHKDRVEALRAEKQNDVEWASFVVGAALEAVATIMTGGGYAGVILTAMAASAAGMGMKEAMLGVDYELLDGDNAIELAAAAAGAAVGKRAGDVLVLLRGGDETFALLNRGNAVQKAMAEKAGEVAGGHLVTATWNDMLPSEDEIAAKAADLLLQIASAGAGAGAGYVPQGLDVRAQTVRRAVVGNVAKSSSEFTTAATVNWIKTGKITEGNGTDWAIALGKDLMKRTLKTFTTTVADIMYPDRPDGSGEGAGWVKDQIAALGSGPVAPWDSPDTEY
jgi:hypothetical protein